MTLPDEVARFLWLRDSGVETGEDPIDYLRRVNDLARRLLPTSLAQQNQRLKSQLAEAEARVSEALDRVSRLEQAAQRQTLMRPHHQEMRRDSSSSEFGPDQLVDSSFVPCRDERCKRSDLHAANTCKLKGRGPAKGKNSHA